MAKKIDIVQAFVWAGNILDTQNLTVPEQAVLFNLLKLINRNFWSPIKISAFKLSRTMGSDTRTVQKALQKLKDITELKTLPMLKIQTLTTTLTMLFVQDF